MELVYSIIFLIIGYGFGSFSTGYVVDADIQGT